MFVAGAARRHAVGRHPRVPAHALQRQRDPDQPDARLCRALVLSWLVHGPWRDPDGFNFPQSPMFTDAASCPILSKARACMSVSGRRARRRSRLGPAFMTARFPGFQMRGRRPGPQAAPLRRLLPKRHGLDRLLLGGGAGRHRRHGRSRRPDRPADAAACRRATASPRSSSPSSAGCIPLGIVLAGLLCRCSTSAARRRRSMLDLPSAATRRVPGHAAVLPARGRLLRQLPRPHRTRAKHRREVATA